MPTQLRRNGTLAGTIFISGLPEHNSLHVTAYLFAVDNMASPLPYGGMPPKAKYPTGTLVFKGCQPCSAPLHFSIEASPGFYHLDLGMIVVREIGDKLYAQVEHMFPQRVACEVVSNQEVFVKLNVQWPGAPISDLVSYGTITPQS